MGLSGAAQGWWWGESKRPRPKICHTYPTMMKLDTVIPELKKIQKINLNHVTHTLSYADISHQHVFTGNQEIEIQIPYWSTISNSFKVFRVFKDCFDKHGYNLNDVSKNGNPRSS